MRVFIFQESKNLNRVLNRFTWFLKFLKKVFEFDSLVGSIVFREYLKCTDHDHKNVMILLSDSKVKKFMLFGLNRFICTF